MLQDALEMENGEMINIKNLVYSKLNEKDLSAYQLAFLEIFFENRQSIYVDLNKELDAFFLQRVDYSGASFEGVIPPSDNSTDWKYMIGLFKGGLTRVAYLEFQFNEWSIKRYSIQSSID